MEVTGCDCYYTETIASVKCFIAQAPAWMTLCRLCGFEKALPTNFGIGGKWLIPTKNLAYYDRQLITVVKGFKV